MSELPPLPRQCVSALVENFQGQAEYRRLSVFCCESSAKFSRAHMLEYAKQAAVDELRRLHEANAALLEAFVKTRQALQFLNEPPYGGIDDTIWMIDDDEKLFEFMDGVIAKATEEESNDRIHHTSPIV